MKPIEFIRARWLKSRIKILNQKIAECEETAYACRRTMEGLVVEREYLTQALRRREAQLEGR